jgi:hypothetical protein
LSRKAESSPVSQKYATTRGLPSGAVSAVKSHAKAPFFPASSIASTGMMQMKMPANRMATSAIGSQVNPLASRCSFGVNASESIAISTRIASRAMFCSSSVVP